MTLKFMGYRRENGRVGVRNHVVILPLDDISNACAEAVANNVKGTIALPHHFGRLQFGRDLELFFRQLIGIGSNPNVAACVVIGIESSHWTTRVAEGIAKTGKPVAMFGIERYGDFNTIERASRKAKEFVHWASELQREECEIADLVVSVKCGESDTTSGLAANPTVGKVVERLTAAGASCSFGETTELTGGEHIVAARMRTPELRDKFMALFNDYQALIMREEADLLGSQPTQGNIIGGLTTIEEKALGNIQKIGNCMVDGVLESAEYIPPRTGKLWFMDTSSAAAEAVTLWAAGGAVIHLFPTGQGNVVGNPIVPVIKLTANPITVSTMSEHIDVDVSGVLRRELTLDQAADKLMDMIIRTANGRLTSAEVLGHREFVINKLYRSA
ncbi:UxaA family hydrolase [Desulfofundulus thermosubterraneus]|uniref:(2R)-sulfolactate sulfo-lyase subunit beta n=1 Tax=Desulfofundulus thermosubterraneus DSM 16057 TaxID=1121432 RepID=A0A1M6CVZ7_9FIRM|nr:UxaA family hydrolase [Desulfofundulus thermosubterraneus]SHI65063.1 (2R)-sulfolactate sulfo-lyase subunit beta [Desulfofundulus thermosubterraneus DSM 16057]